MVNPNRFYTYAYLREDRTPYYIGKGQGRRAYKKGSNETIKLPKDKSRIIILKKNLTEKEAFKHEIYMIVVFGRKDNGTGILRNLTDGGDGMSGYKHSDEALLFLRERMIGNQFAKGYKHFIEIKEKISKANKGRVHTEERNKKISKSKIKYLYEIKSPNGEVFITNNLTEFCKENPQYGLYRRLMCDVAHGKQKHHKGWTVRILEHIT
jgi:hypothetical protein